MFEPIDILILKTVALYYTLQRVDIQRLCMPHTDDDGARAGVISTNSSNTAI